MFARFDENPAMTLRVIKETKRYGRTDGRTDARTDGQRENSIPPTNKVCWGYKKILMTNGSLVTVESIAECSPTFDLHQEIIGLENQFSVFLRVATLHRLYCTVYFMTNLLFLNHHLYLLYVSYTDSLCLQHSL